MIPLPPDVQRELENAATQLFMAHCGDSIYTKLTAVELLAFAEAAYRLATERAREEAVHEFRMDELEAVMLSVDKWFDEDDPRLKNNPATRAADAREIALQAIEAAAIRGQEGA